MIEAAYTEQALRLTTGDMTFTVPGFGTPQLVLFMVGESTVLGTRRNTSGVLITGATDGVNQFSISNMEQAVAGSVYNRNVQSASHCIIAWCGPTTSYIYKAAFKEFVTDGVTLTATVDGWQEGELLVCAYLLKGFDNVKVGNFLAPEVDSSVVVSDVGFEASAVIFQTLCEPDNETVTANNYLSYGYAHNTTEIPQYACSPRPFDYSYLADNHAITYYSGHSYTDAYGNITAFDTAGFTMYNKPVSSLLTDSVMFYIALKTTESIYLGSTTTKASSGNDSINLGFKPNIIFSHVLAKATALNAYIEYTSGDDYESHSFGISIPSESRVINKVDSEYSTTDYGAGTTKDGFIFLEEHTTEGYSTLINATITERTATGIDINYTASTEKILIIFAIGDYTPPEFHPVDKFEGVTTTESITLLREIFGSVTCGHVTDAIEDNVLPFSPFFTGTAQAKNTGDSEVLVLGDNDYVESETFELGEGDCKIDQNKYGTGGEGTLYYRTATTRTACDAAEWTAYTGTFTSLGFVGVKIVKEV